MYSIIQTAFIQPSKLQVYMYLLSLCTLKDEKGFYLGGGGTLIYKSDSGDCKRYQNVVL